MNAFLRRLTFGLGVVCCGAFVGAADTPAKKAETPPGFPAADSPEMKAMMAAMAPGPQHAELAKAAGEWSADCEHYMPGGAVEKSKGSAKRTMIMGGRFLREEFKGSVMGEPFTGEMILGYDNNLKRFDSVWCDSMSTGVMVSHSKGNDPEELVGSMYCPINRKEVTVRLITKDKGPDEQLFEMHAPGPDGKETLMMRITYHRKK
ncbi:MAG: DUF1579 domain-containing protein [Pirellulales bacterium]